MGKAVFEVATLGWAGHDILQGLVLIGPLFSVKLPSQCPVSGISDHLRVEAPWMNDRFVIWGSPVLLL